MHKSKSLYNELKPLISKAQFVAEVWCETLKIEVRHAAQFERQARTDDTQPFTNYTRISVLEIERRHARVSIDPMDWSRLLRHTGRSRSVYDL